MFGITSTMDKALEAIKSRDSAAVKELLSKINLEKKGFDLLLEAASCAYPEIIELLADNGCEISDYNGGLLLMNCIDQRYGAKEPEDVLKACRYLVSKGADVNTKLDGLSPLLLVAKNAYRKGFHAELAKLLLDNGANVFDQDDKGWGVLPHCLYKSGAPIELIELLVEAGVDLNAEVTGDFSRIECMHSNLSEYENVLTLARRNNKQAYKLMLRKGAKYDPLEDSSITNNLESRKEYDAWLINLDFNMFDGIKNTLDFRLLELIHKLRVSSTIKVIDLSSASFYYDHDIIYRAIRDRSDKVASDMKAIKNYSDINLPVEIQATYMSTPNYYLKWGYRDQDYNFIIGGEFCLYSLYHAIIENEPQANDEDPPVEQGDVAAFRFFDTHLWTGDNYRAAIKLSGKSIEPRVYIDETGFFRFQPLEMSYPEYMEHTLKLAGLYDWQYLFWGYAPAHDPECRELAEGLRVLKEALPGNDYSDYERRLEVIRNKKK